MAATAAAGAGRGRRRSVARGWQEAARMAPGGGGARKKPQGPLGPSRPGLPQAGRGGDGGSLARRRPARRVAEGTGTAEGAGSGGGGALEMSHVGLGPSSVWQLPLAATARGGGGGRRGGSPKHGATPVKGREFIFF
ncbi:spidroin-1-like [Ananas comosus]|uniref:Spidroin-1-like n=1 Tax=Ananas comosus TaxID=4615 RepID=A0A6P5EDY7_ANACO|nr:spidroin-1-like [Ananas comosus]